MAEREQIFTATEEDTQNGKYLTFNIGNEEYGIEICYVTEIVGIQSITEVPEMPQYMKGIINLRGKIIPVMDVRLRFGKEFQKYNERTCVIVVEMSNLSLGLVVDGVAEVLNIHESEIVPPPGINRNCQQNFISGIGKVGQTVKLLLDCNRLLNNDEKDVIPELIITNQGGNT